MFFISACLFAISANIDNLVVGLSYGLKKIRISVFQNIIIAVISGVGTAISIYLGKIIVSFIPENLPKILGACILILIGAWPIIKSIVYRKEKIRNNDVYNNPEKYDEDKSRIFRF